MTTQDTIGNSTKGHSVPLQCAANSNGALTAYASVGVIAVMLKG